VGSGGTTVTWLWADVPLSGPAVIVAVPGASPATVTGAVTAPAGTVTVAGTLTIPASLLLRGTTVSVPCAALMVTVRVPLAPWVTLSVAGRRLVSVGPAGKTVMVLWRVRPLRAAVMVATPGVATVTGIGTATRPAGTATEAGTEPTAGALLVRVIVVALDCGALMVAVRVPLLPCVRDRLAGSSPVRVGPGHRLELLEAVAVRVLPSGPFSAQTRSPSPKGT
jgi:hypothetical protein